MSNNLNRQQRRRLKSGKTKIENHKDGGGATLILSAEEHALKSKLGSTRLLAAYREAYGEAYAVELAELMALMLLPPPPNTPQHEAFNKKLESAVAVVYEQFGLKKI